MTADSDRHLVGRQLPLHALQILVVDDDEGARGVLRSILEAEGASVLTAGSAAEALSQLEAVRPHAMLVDISMPVVNGFTFVEQLRLRPTANSANMPIAALTGYLSAEDRERALRAGFQAYLVKPMDPAELVEAVRTLVLTRR